MKVILEGRKNQSLILLISSGNLQGGGEVEKEREKEKADRSRNDLTL